MPSSRVTFALCLGFSVAVHATLILTLPRGSPANPPKRAALPIYHVAPPGTVPEPPPPPPQFGEAGGVGDAINSSPGEAIQTAPKSRPDQAALTRDPTGQGPSAAVVSPKPLGRPVTSPPPVAPPEPPPSPAPAFRQPAKPAPPAPPKPPSPKPPSPKPPSPPAPPAPHAPPSDATPGAPAAGGRPMPHSDRDSDPFAKATSLEFKQGRVAARNGREVKFARPRDNLASLMDSAEIPFPARLGLRVTVDATGHVRNVRVVRSTGSSSIDRAFLLATYESWFEPAKDAAGRPVADEVDFGITLE